jgi:hypothetical protein
VRYVGATMEIEQAFATLCGVPGDWIDPVTQASICRVDRSDAFLVQPPNAPHPRFQDGMRAFSDAIENVVAPFGPVLVDLYMQFVHPAFPVLDRADFLLAYRSAPTCTAPSSSTLLPPLLAAVYLLGLTWWAKDARTACLDPAVSMPNVSMLESLAYRSLEAAMARPDLATVQAGILLLQRADGESWALTARVVAVAHDLGLHLDASAWQQLAPWERGLRKRVAWALFMQDKWGALRHGRPSHLAAANWAVGELTHADFEATADDNKDDAGADAAAPTSLLFNRMVALTIILSDILDTFYSLRAVRDISAAGKNGTRLVLDRAKPIQIQLKDWFTRLPACLRMDRTKPETFPSLGRFYHLLLVPALVLFSLSGRWERWWWW